MVNLLTYGIKSHLLAGVTYAFHFHCAIASVGSKKAE